MGGGKKVRQSYEVLGRMLRAVLVSERRRSDSLKVRCWERGDRLVNGRKVRMGVGQELPGMEESETVGESET